MMGRSFNFYSATQIFEKLIFKEFWRKKIRQKPENQLVATRTIDGWKGGQASHTDGVWTACLVGMARFDIYDHETDNSDIVGMVQYDVHINTKSINFA